MIPLIKDELDKRKWIGEDELPDIIALAQSAPGILAGREGQHCRDNRLGAPVIHDHPRNRHGFHKFQGQSRGHQHFQGNQAGGGIIDSGTDHLDGKEILQDMVGVGDRHSQPSAGIFPGGLPYLYHNVGHRARFGRR